MSSGSFDQSWHKQAAIRDIISLVIVYAVLTSLAIRFDVFAHLASIEQKDATSPVGEILVALALLGLAATIYSIRRWQELRRVVANYQLTEQALQESAERYRDLSTHDILTGLYNRTYCEQVMATLRRPDRSQFPVSILMADVDGMKVTNDTLGHAAGDELLRRVASVLRGAFRGEDVVARFGGDEFVVLMMGVGDEGAQQMLGRVKARLAEHNRAHHGPPLRFSVGVATAHDDRMLAAALRLADARMYTDKRQAAAKSLRGQSIVALLPQPDWEPAWCPVGAQERSSAADRSLAA